MWDESFSKVALLLGEAGNDAIKAHTEIKDEQNCKLLQITISAQFTLHVSAVNYSSLNFCYTLSGRHI